MPGGLCLHYWISSQLMIRTWGPCENRLEVEVLGGIDDHESI